MTTYIMNWGVFFEELPGGGEKYWQLIVSGVIWTLAVSACAWIIAIVLGSLIGTIRTTTSPWLVRFGNAWVELFRNIPLLVQMFLWYFVIPEFIPPLKSWIVHTAPANAQFVAAVLCLGLFTSARIAEKFRARELGEYTFNFFEAFMAATLIYIVIAMTANRVMAVIERRTAVPGYIA